MVLAGVGYLIVAVGKIAVVEKRIEDKIDMTDYVLLKKTVEAIKEHIESRGETIIIRP